MIPPLDKVRLYESLPPTLEWIENLSWVIFCVSLSCDCVCVACMCGFWLYHSMGEGKENTVTASFPKLSSHKWGIKASKGVRAHLSPQWQLSLLKIILFLSLSVSLSLTPLSVFIFIFVSLFLLLLYPVIPCLGYLLCLATAHFSWRDNTHRD